MAGQDVDMGLYHLYDEDGSDVDRSADAGVDDHPDDHSDDNNRDDNDDDDGTHAVPDTDIDANNGRDDTNDVNNEHGAPVVRPSRLGRLRHWLHRAPRMSRRVLGCMLNELLQRHGRNPVAGLRRLLGRLGRAPGIAWERYRWRRETTQLVLEILVKIGAVAGGIGLAAAVTPRLPAWWSSQGDVVPYKEVDFFDQSIALGVIFSTLPAAFMWGDLGPLREANATFNLNIHLDENSLPPGDATSFTGAPIWVSNSANRPIPERYFVEDLGSVTTSLCDQLRQVANDGPPTFRFTNGSSTQFRWSTDPTDPRAITFLPPHATLPAIMADDLSGYFRRPSGPEAPDDGPPEPTARPMAPAFVENLEPPLDRLCLRLEGLVDRLRGDYPALIDNGVYDDAPRSARLSLQALEETTLLVRAFFNEDWFLRPDKEPFGRTDRSRILCLRNQTASLNGQGSNPQGASCDQPAQSRNRTYLSWSQRHNDTADTLLHGLIVHTVHVVIPAMGIFLDKVEDGIVPRYIKTLEELIDVLGPLIEYAEQVGLDFSIDSSPFPVVPMMPACEANCIPSFCRLMLPFLAEVAIPRLHDMAHRASVGNHIMKEGVDRVRAFERVMKPFKPLFDPNASEESMDEHMWIDTNSPERGLMVFPHVRELLKDLEEVKEWVEMTEMIHRSWHGDEIRRFLAEVSRPGLAARPMLFSRLGTRDARRDPYGADAVMTHTDQRCVDACEGKLATESTWRSNALEALASWGLRLPAALREPLWP